MADNTLDDFDYFFDDHFDFSDLGDIPGFDVHPPPLPTPAPTFSSRPPLATPLDRRHATRPPSLCTPNNIISGVLPTPHDNFPSSATGLFVDAASSITPGRPSDLLALGLNPAPRHSTSSRLDNSLLSAAQIAPSHPQSPSLPLPTVQRRAVPTATSNTAWRPRAEQAHNHLSSSPQREPTSDDWLNELATRDFSSPSILAQSPHWVGGLNSSAGLLSGLSYGTTVLGNHQVGRGQFGQGGDTGLSRGENSQTESQDLSATLHSRPIPPEMPATRRSSGRNSAAERPDIETITSSSPISNTRSIQNSLQQGPARVVGKRKRDSAEDPQPKTGGGLTDDDIFGDNEIKTIDLADTDKVPDEHRFQKPKPKNLVKLSSFQCVICMDDVTDLTVTHCGHLFCAECLHSSLHIDATKKICPICRQKVDLRAAGKKVSQKVKSYYPLELKLTTRKSLGKRNAQP
ncbi:hypothetical protein B0T22DRAFT_9123 [Podospora appendiculata]|uniref:RING-type domain-containing protein n=1 Tax=Podospora appendiculata TaxID=314037 RepID=A0AAE1CFB1_9PEZI|nr:hypothetical protein B0T22DRAFT_9123 [Podospora appendiculata]